MKNSLFRTIFVFTLILFFLPVLANACSCISSGPPCQSFGNTYAVFTGKVESISDYPTTTNAGNSKFQYVQKAVKLTVTESFRGIKENSVEIITGRGGGDCGYNFESGREYVVYAYQNKETGKLGTGICTRTRPIEKAEEDLQYFREIAKGAKDISIYGQVFRTFTRKQDEPYRNPEPLENIILTLSNGETISTNEKGEYRFDKLLPQEYTITPTIPNGLWGGNKPEGKVKLNPNGCAVVSFWLSANTSLSGKLFDENSQPLPDTSVQLVPVDQINVHQKDLQMAHTDNEGRYIFHSIPNGDYYLGVRLFRIADLLFPYPRTFYPNTLSLAEAKVITIKEGNILKDFEIKIGQKLKQRKVSGIVVYPDGKPAENATVIAEEVEYSENSMGYAFQANKDGTFTLTLSEGLRHIIKAVVPATDTPARQRHAEPIEIPANGEVNNVRLVITEPNGTCSKCFPWRRQPK